MGEACVKDVVWARVACERVVWRVKEVVACERYVFGRVGRGRGACARVVSERVVDDRAVCEWVVYEDLREERFVRKSGA